MDVIGNLPIDHAILEVSKYLSGQELSLTDRKRFNDLYDALLALRKMTSYQDQERAVAVVAELSDISDPPSVLQSLLAIVMPFEK